MVKVLIVITTAVVEYGGLYTVMKNYLYNMDRTGLFITIASGNDISSKIRDELEGQGIEYLKLPNRKAAILLYFKALYINAKKNKYDVIHINGNSATMMIEYVAAYFSGIKKKIVHCHTSNTKYKYTNRVLGIFLRKSKALKIAVSELSGNWLFGKDNYIVLNNAINLSRFKYVESTAKEYRKCFFLEDNYVIGTIGKLNGPKNHVFLIDVLSELLKYDERYKLVIVGEGLERKKIQEKAILNNCESNLILTGGRNDNAELLTMMDIFVFPSIYEGFGMALVEAQASGLPCVCSLGIPDNAKICDNVETLSFDACEWAKTINKMVAANHNCTRISISEKNCNSIRNAGFCIENEAQKLRNIYIDLKN